MRSKLRTHVCLVSSTVSAGIGLLADKLRRLVLRSREKALRQRQRLVQKLRPDPNHVGWREFAAAFWGSWLAKMSGGFSVPFAAVGIFFAESAKAQTFWFILAGAALVVSAYFVWAAEHKRAKELEKRLRPEMSLIFKPAFPWVVPVPAGRIQIDPLRVIEVPCLFFCLQIHNPKPDVQLKGVRVSLTNVERLENDAWAGRGFGASIPLRWVKTVTDLFEPRDIAHLDGCYVDVVSVDAHYQKVLIKQEMAWQSDAHLFDQPGKYRLTIAAIPAEGEGQVAQLLLNWTGQWDQTTMEMA